MRFVISPIHLESFQEYAVRLELSVDELIAKVFEAEENRLFSMIGTSHRVSFAPGDKTIQDLSDLTTRSVTLEVQHALDVLEAVEKEIPYVDTSRLSQAATVEHLLKSMGQSLTEIELNVVPSYGRSTTANQTSFGSTRYSLYYDIQLVEAVKLVSLYAFYFTMDMRSEPARKRSAEETRALVNSYPKSRWSAAMFFVGLADWYDSEFDPLPGEVIDAGKNASAAFKFFFYHELAHHLLSCDSRVGGLDICSTELTCDEFASIVFARAIGSGHIDLIEACIGLVSLFFVQHMKEVYSRLDVEVAESYPRAIERLARIPRQWEDYDPQVLVFPFNRMWKVLEAAFHDYATLCRSLHFNSGNHPVVFTGKYFCASLVEGLQLSVWPHDLTADELLKRLRAD
jgi:hypothetical protein